MKATAEDILHGERCSVCGGWPSGCLCASPGPLQAQTGQTPPLGVEAAPEGAGEAWGETTGFAWAVLAAALAALVAFLVYA